jgi:hypothetical protein
MPWEQRKGRGRYYTRTERRGGRRVRVYYGTGLAAEALAYLHESGRLLRQMDATQRAMERDRMQEEWRHWQEEMRGIDGPADGLARLALEAAGYRQHNRGEWRRRQGMATETTDPGTGSPKAPSPSENFKALITRVGQGDQEAVGALTAMLARALPHLTWDDLDMMGHHIRVPLEKVRSQLIARVAGDFEGDQDATAQKLFIRQIVQEVTRRLAGANPTGIEYILAERAAICWLWAYVEDLTILNRGAASIEQLRFDLQRQNAAHKRFLAAVKTLATVRRLAVPVLLQKVKQVNVNVGGTQKVTNKAGVDQPS